MKRRETSPLLSFLLRNMALGIGVGWLLVALLVWQDAAGLRQLLGGAENPFLALALLLFGVTITFGSLAMGSAVFLLPGISDCREDDF